ncbi:MAG TPA: peptide chain release factor N(5)-glutamine methyltransferase [Gemmatimonadaceae bacterium]|nr:peptide chain release factor N(5)-glutamine methyltransferase [Gemmatimonadaceae bacterium]
MSEATRLQRHVAASTGSVAALVDELARFLAASLPGREATLEAREIVAALYDVPRFWPAANAHLRVEAEMWPRARAAAEKRARGAPLAYAVGRASFRHLTLDVDERVLIPRPETELLVDLVLDRARDSGGLAVDVGTGSGAIALALASEGSFTDVVGTDVSLDALAVASANVEMLRARGVLRSRVSLAHGSLLKPFDRRGRCAQVIVSNPPYIAYDESRELPRDVRDWEPPVALFSGAQGLDASARLVAGAADVLVPGGLLALEVDARRASLVAECIARDTRYRDVGVHLDLTGRERFVLAVCR